jgi:hypothetical protein
MVPASFDTFFSIMAGVGATLFGLIFLVITIKPDHASTESNPVLRQAQIASAYSALLNPLVISLLALVPHASIGLITLIMSVIGLVNTFIIGLSLLPGLLRWRTRLQSLLLLLGSSVIFGFELLYAIQLETRPQDRAPLYNLTTLLVIVYLYGIARAWDLVSARQFHIWEVFSRPATTGVENAVAATPDAGHTEGASTPND